MPLRHIKRYVPCKVRRDFDPDYHCHVIEITDIATGIQLPRGGWPLTAFRWRCTICGFTMDDVTRYGIEQLQAGHKTGHVFQWMEEPDAPADTAGAQ